MAKPQSPILLLTCEHGGNEIPPQYHPLFEGADEVLESHRGWDPGALELAREMADAFGVPLEFSKTSRLLIELNRSLDHAALFSEYSRRLPAEAQQQLINGFYRPYREAVEQGIAFIVKQALPIVHLSVHSFTPELNGEIRDADIGLLYDPCRAWETSFCHAWRGEILQIAPRLRVRMNYPYQGADDGLTTYLRTKFADGLYAGIELEVNQRFPLGAEEAWFELQTTLIESLSRTLNPAQTNRTP